MRFKIADFVLQLNGQELHAAIKRLDAFRNFYLDEGEANLSCDTIATFQCSNDVSEYTKIEYRFVYQDVDIQGSFGSTANGYRMDLCPNKGDSLVLWSDDRKNFFLKGSLAPDLFRFALWVGMGIFMADKCAVAIHSSAILYNNKVAIFLGESGTGKSTHTRLWRESIPGATLLNDDSPIIRFVDGKVWVYGSPWSGKTPCYRNERYELAACVRLSQALYNKMRKLNVLQAYSAIHPSSPPQFAYNEVLYDGISTTLGKILSSAPVYHLECLPNAAAAQLSCKTVFDREL